MANQYRSIFPVSQQSTYRQNENLDFVLNLEGEKLIPGSVVLEGKWATWANRGAVTRVQGHERIYYDALTGAHALCRDLTTEFQNLGIVENFQNYPRYVKMHACSTMYDESVGTETANSVEGRVHTARQAKGMVEGQNASEYAIPFSVKLLNVLNKATGPLSSSATGQMRLRLRLAPDSEVYYGEDYAAGQTSYDLTEVRLRYQTIPDDGKPQPVQLEMYHSYRAVLDSNNVNVSTFVPGLSDSVHMSFIKQSDENTQGNNYLACQPPIGEPPLGYSDIGTSLEDYGIERLYYAINDTDTALVGFTMESREEIVANGLRSFKAPAGKYDAILRKLRNPVISRRDGYVAGIPFGGLLDFSKNKFATEIQTKCDSNNQLYACYLFFRMLFEVNA